MNRFHTTVCTVALILGCISAVHASPRQEVLPGPVPVEILSVLDGDTVSVKARVWIGSNVETSVRIAGIDAPRNQRQVRERAHPGGSREARSRKAPRGEWR